MKYNKDYNNQLFKKKLDADLLTLIQNIYNIKDLHNYTFSKQAFEENNITDKIDIIKFILYDYYLNCKGYKYLENITIKKSITILKHILKEFGFNIKSSIKYSHNNKTTIYNIIKNKDLSQADLTVDFE
tara:strand:- start:892 stop:1278 length:387 start_codon:yes stop_codon:yes gene_type:complete